MSEFKSIFLSEGEVARVEPGLPHGGQEDGRPTLDLTVRTTPRHQATASQVSPEVALELAHRIILKLIELGQPISKPCDGKDCHRLNTEPCIDPETGRLLWLCTSLCHPDYYS